MKILNVKVKNISITFEDMQSSTEKTRFILLSTTVVIF